MRTLRTLHLYPGSLFAPALLVLAASGAWQVFRWNYARKHGSYTPAPIVAALSANHKDQVLPPAQHGQDPAMQGFLLAASAGLTLTTCLGIVMACGLTRRPLVVSVLLLGGLLSPAVFLTSCTKKPAAARPRSPAGEVTLKVAAPGAAAPGKTASPAPAPPWTPGLGELMSLQQMRHVKLWFAGQAGNWKLAAYELDELEEGFQDVVRLHPTHKDSPVPIPEAVSKIVQEPLAEVGRAIEARDRARFARSFDALTDGCNSCHRATNFGFNVVQRPASNPYSNQSFAAPKPSP
jgi:hypothetical protein